MVDHSANVRSYRVVPSISSPTASDGRVDGYPDDTDAQPARSTRTGSGPGQGEARPRGGGSRPGAPLTRVSSVTNEVWLSDEFAVRINRRPGQAAAARGAARPASAGRGPLPGGRRLRQRRGLRLAGEPAQRAATSSAGAGRRCRSAQRRLAVRQLAFMLRALHDDADAGAARRREGPRCAATAEVRHRTRSGRRRCSTRSRAPRKLPVRRPRRHVRPGRAGRCASGSTIEPFDARTLIHGDLTFENVLWDGDEVTALIDFEWARPAPRDLELDVLLRFCAYPFLHVADDYEAQTKAEAYEEVPSWLAEDYPQLFTRTATCGDRLRLYAIAFEVRQLLMLPPAAPAAPPVDPPSPPPPPPTADPPQLPRPRPPLILSRTTNVGAPWPL